MTMPAQHSVTSLSRYATAKSPAVDLHNGSASRDFCNSFWGVGDDGANIVFARMRGATKTTDELRNFWTERSAIEEQYATRLAALAKMSLGGDEIGELRNSLDTLRLETGKQAATHLDLASQIRAELEATTSLLHAKQVNYRRNVQAAVEKKFKAKQTQESYVAKAREKYDGDCLRIASYTQQINLTKGKDLERIQLKLKRAEQTVKANEEDLASFTKVLLELLPGWELEWKEFCDTCQDLEEERLEFMKDTLWAYANGVSTICVSDDQSCERIRTVLDQLEPDRDVENFVNEYGTGNLIPNLHTFTPGKGPQDLASTSSAVSSTRSAEFTRVSRRPPAAAYRVPEVDPRTQTQPREPTSGDAVAVYNHANGREPSSPQSQSGGAQGWQEAAPTRTRSPRSRDEGGVVGSATAQPPRTGPPNVPPPPLPVASRSTSPRRRQSQPLPTPGPHQHSGIQDHPSPPPPPPPPPSNEETGGVLFYVKALYDYTATIDEEFDFQAGDVIAVTATPDDGWWSGELLDEARREDGRHVFPSNFVCLF